MQLSVIINMHNLIPNDITPNTVSTEDAVVNPIEKKADLIDAEKTKNVAMNQQSDEWVFNFLRSRLINIITNNIDTENDFRAFSIVFYMIQFIREKEIRERLTDAFIESCTFDGVLKTNYKVTWKKCILMAGVVYDVIHANQLSCNLIGKVSADDEMIYGETEEIPENDETETMITPEMRPKFS